MENPPFRHSRPAPGRERQASHTSCSSAEWLRPRSAGRSSNPNRDFRSAQAFRGSRSTLCSDRPYPDSARQPTSDSDLVSTVHRSKGLQNATSASLLRGTGQSSRRSKQKPTRGAAGAARSLCPGPRDDMATREFSVIPSRLPVMEHPNTAPHRPRSRTGARRHRGLSVARIPQTRGGCACGGVRGPTLAGSSRSAAGPESLPLRTKPRGGGGQAARLPGIFR